MVGKSRLTIQLNLTMFRYISAGVTSQLAFHWLECHGAENFYRCLLFEQALLKYCSMTTHGRRRTRSVIEENRVIRTWHKMNISIIKGNEMDNSHYRQTFEGSNKNEIFGKKFINEIFGKKFIKWELKTTCLRFQYSCKVIESSRIFVITKNHNIAHLDF
jgi:hypothetical protein